MRYICFVAFHVATCVLIFLAQGVPTRPHYTREHSKQSERKPDHFVQAGLKSLQKGPGLFARNGDFLDKIIQTRKRKYPSKKVARDSSSEVAEFWKYMGKEHVTTVVRNLPQSSKRRLKAFFMERKYEVLKPFLPPHIFLAPIGSISSPTPEPEESVEPSPEMNVEMTPSPSMDPDSEMLEPVHTPAPDDRPKQTFPSLVTTENESGEILYRPWDSLYVRLRRLSRN